MQERLARLRQIWQETSQTNKIMILAAGSVALVVAVVFLFWASSPEYSVLISNAPSESAGKILAQLKEKKIPYRTNGGTIEVPAAQCDELRMSLATDGLLATGSQGWNLLEKAPFGQTQAMESETIRHAHEVMMEHSISTLDAVSSATVHFTDGDKSELFDAEKKEGAASVIVRVKPGQELTKENVRAIVALLQSGYSNIPARNINLVDGEGRLRWNGSEQADGLSSSDDRQVQEARYSANLTNEIQAHINSIIGPGKSAVMVRATLNLDKRIKKIHEVQPGAVTNKTSMTENLSGGSMNGQRPAMGAAGVASNTAGGTPPVYTGQDVNTNGTGKYVNEQTTQTTQPSITDTEATEAPGEIKSAFVIVTLDKKVAPDAIATLKQQIPMVMGDDPNAPNPAIRVSVETADFDTKAQELDRKSAESAAATERMNRWLGYGVPLVVMMLMLFVLSRAFRKPVAAGNLLAMPGAQPALALAGAGAGMGGQGGGLDILIGSDSPTGMNVEQALSGEGGIVPVGGEPATHTYSVIAEQFDANLESITHLAKSKPETIALLLRTWQTEDRK